MPVKTTHNLRKIYDAGKYREGIQRRLVVEMLLRSETPQTEDSLVESLDAAPHWDTVRRKDRNGRPLPDSWFIRKAKGVRGSIHYHLRELKKLGLIEVS